MRERMLQWMVTTALDAPGRVLGIAAVFGLVSLALIPGLEVDASHTGMMDPTSPHMVRAKRFHETFGAPNQLLVVVEGGSEALRRELIDGLTERLTAPEGATASPCDESAGPNAPGCVRSVTGRVDVEAFEELALLYLGEEDLVSIVEALADENLGVAALRRTTNLASLLATLGDGLEARADTGEGDQDGAEEAIRGVRDLLVALRERLDGTGSRPLRDTLAERDGGGEAALLGEGLDAKGYLSTADGTLKLALIRPVHESDAPGIVMAFVGYVERHVAAVEEEVAGRCADAAACPEGPIRISYTGLPALVADEARSLGRDLAVTTGLALLGICLLFGLAFRSIRILVIGIFPLLLSLLGTLAFARVAFGSLNLITSAFMATLIGLGIDFSIHLMSRFQEAQRGGGDPREAIREAVLRCGPGLLTGGITSAGAFMALVVNDVPAFAEMGVLSGVGLLLSLVATLTVLPAMIVSERLAFLRPEPRQERSGRSGARLVAFITAHPAKLLVAGILLAALMIPAGRDNGYNWNYPEYMPEGLPSVETWLRLNRDTEFSTEAAALVADGPEEARAFVDALEGLPTVRRVEALPVFLPAGQGPKLAMLAALAPALEGTVEPVKVSRSEGAARLRETLEDIRFDAKRTQSDQLAALEDLLAASRALEAVIERIDPEAEKRAQALDKEILDLRDKALGGLRRLTTGRPVTLDELAGKLPPEMAGRLRSGSQYAVYAYPALPLGEEANVVAFLADLHTVDEGPVGFAVEHWHNMTSTIEGFEEAFLLALLAVCLLVFADFRSLVPTLASLFPLAVAITWVWGGMALLEIQYNPGNIIAFPLILGIGVDAGVHIVHRWEQEGRSQIGEVIRHTGFAVLMSTGTTMIGFGALSLATNRALASLGVVLLLGVGACLVTATVLLPAWLHTRRPRA